MDDANGGYDGTGGNDNVLQTYEQRLMAVQASSAYKVYRKGAMSANERIALRHPLRFFKPNISLSTRVAEVPRVQDTVKIFETDGSNTSARNPVENFTSACLDQSGQMFSGGVGDTVFIYDSRPPLFIDTSLLREEVDQGAQMEESSRMYENRRRRRSSSPHTRERRSKFRSPTLRWSREDSPEANIARPVQRRNIADDVRKRPCYAILVLCAGILFLVGIYLAASRWIDVFEQSAMDTHQRNEHARSVISASTSPTNTAASVASAAGDHEVAWRWIYISDIFSRAKDAFHEFIVEDLSLGDVVTNDGRAYTMWNSIKTGREQETTTTSAADKDDGRAAGGDAGVSEGLAGTGTSFIENIRRRSII